MFIFFIYCCKRALQLWMYIFDVHLLCSWQGSRRYRLCSRHCAGCVHCMQQQTVWNPPPRKYVGNLWLAPFLLSVNLTEVCMHCSRLWCKPHYVKTWRHPANWKDMTHCIVKEAQITYWKSSKLWRCGFETCKHTDRQDDHSTWTDPK